MPGQGDPLPLPDRQLLAAIELGPEHRLVPLGQLGQELVGAGVDRRPADGRDVADPLVAAHADVLGGRQRVVEEVLEDDGHRPAQPVGVGSGGVELVPQHPPGMRQVQPAQQLGQGGLAGAVLADQGDNLAGPDLHRHASHGRGGGARVGEADVLDPQAPEPGRCRAPRPPRLDLGGHGHERGEVLDEQRRFVQHPGAEDGVHEPLAEDEHRPGGRPGVGQADAAAQGQDQEGGHDPGQHHRGGQVPEQRHPQPPPGHLAELVHVLVVQPVEALAQEPAEAEGPQLLGRVLARQQHVEGCGGARPRSCGGGTRTSARHPWPQRSAGARAGQDQRHQPRLEGQQGQGDPGDADDGPGQPGQPLDDLPGPELAATGRPDQPVVEGGSRRPPARPRRRRR